MTDQSSPPARPGALALVALLALLIAAGLETMAIVVNLARGNGVGDWVSFYAAGAIVWHGDGERLYDPAVQAAVQHGLFRGAGATFNAFPLPAFVALAFAPLSAAGFTRSFAVWALLNAVLLLALLTACWRYLAALPPATRAAVAAAVAISTPVVNTLLFGQLDLFVLAAIASSFAMMCARRRYAAGVLLALALAKPDLVLGVALLFAVTREWRALAAFLAAGAILVLGPAFLLGPHILVDQVTLLAHYPASSADYSTNAAMMVNVRGAIASLTGADRILVWGAPQALVAAVGAGMAIRVWRARGGTDAQSWAVALMLPLIASPHMHMQSLVLLVAACALYLRAAADHGHTVTPDAAVAPLLAVSALWFVSLWGPAIVSLPVLAVFWLCARRWPVAREASARRALPRAA
ncbi:MAG: glycosyltransferase family 87 protein [Dehalococcoidia bacterium]